MKLSASLFIVIFLYESLSWHRFYFSADQLVWFSAVSLAAELSVAFGGACGFEVSSLCTQMSSTPRRDPVARGSYKELPSGVSFLMTAWNLMKCKTNSQN